MALLRQHKTPRVPERVRVELVLHRQNTTEAAVVNVPLWYTLHLNTQKMESNLVIVAIQLSLFAHLFGVNAERSRRPAHCVWSHV